MGLEHVAVSAEIEVRIVSKNLVRPNRKKLPNLKLETEILKNESCFLTDQSTENPMLNLI